ncbi:hypothetical protein H1Q59_01045 [Holosporaceae bacterium 'Namur']|nr:hypothetical protein [Holosporaceae bacterium 'Namur']
MINALFKPSSLIGILALILSSILLFEIKYSVQKIRKELNSVDNEIIKAKEDIHILKAELSYITKPESLAKLSRKSLNLVSIDPTRIKSVHLGEINKFFLEEGTE